MSSSDCFYYDIIYVKIYQHPLQKIYFTNKKLEISIMSALNSI